VEEKTGSVELAYLAFGATLGGVFGGLMLVIGEIWGGLGSLGYLFEGFSVLGWSWVGATILWCAGIGVTLTGLWLAIKEPLDTAKYYFGLFMIVIGVVMTAIGYALATGAAVISAPFVAAAVGIGLAIALIIDTFKILLSGGSLIETWQDRWGKAIDWITEKWDGLAASAGELKDSISSDIGGMRDTVVSFGEGMVEGFMEKINGIGAAFKMAWNLLVDEINPAIRMFNEKVGSIPGIPNIPELGYLAKGGPATGGKPYIVGEQGPELFTPGSSGHVTPNHELGGGGGSVTLNINVSGVTDRTDKRALAREIGDMLTQEMRRQGGSTTRGRF
jgi:hypothetical protein